MGDIFEDHLPPIIPSKPQERIRTRSNRREIISIASSDLRSGQLQLASLASRAFELLEEALEHAEYPVAVQAAKLILDRSGFGPTSTLKVDDSLDLSDLSDEELRAFALRLAQSGVEESGATDSHTTRVH